VSKCCFASNSGATSALAGSPGFAQSAPMALQRITDAGDRSLILILSDINMPGMSGL
jgi:CheY-like chemotaxis protein